jgi:hypothetical protein
MKAMSDSIGRMMNKPRLALSPDTTVAPDTTFMRKI